MWGIVTGFLGKFSIKQYIYAGIALAALTLALNMYGDVKGHFERVNNLEEANKELEIQKSALEIEKKSSDVLINALQTTIETQAEAITIVNEDFAEARDEAERQKRILEGTRLGRLAAERAALIESQTNAATEERMTEIEGVINEDF